VVVDLARPYNDVVEVLVDAGLVAALVAASKRPSALFAI
jgi:hypothetical protein